MSKHDRPAGQDDRPIEIRTCPKCDRDYPWWADTPKEIRECRYCIVIETRKRGVASVTSGHGTGFGNTAAK